MIYDTINPEIVKYILNDSSRPVRILDVGCGTGKLGRLLKSKISCHITGIEVDKEAVTIAGEVYDELVVMDLEELIVKTNEFVAKNKFDYIIFGDILEHVTDPSQLLKSFAGVLENNGFLIASIPNVANWMVRFRLLFGNFDYSGGILHQWHLRFFTYKTAKRLLEDNGYKIVSVVNNNQTWIIRFLGRIWKKMFAFQFVFKCKNDGA